MNGEVMSDPGSRNHRARSMAERAGSTIVEVDASHSVAVSQPKAVS
jgi:hypothetical protein